MNSLFPFRLCLVLFCGLTLQEGFGQGNQNLRSEKLADGVVRYYFEGQSSDFAFVSVLKETWNLLTFSNQKLPFGKSIALLAGVSDYQHNDIRDLPFVKIDLENMRNFLLTKGGFDEVYVMQGEIVTSDLIELYIKKVLPSRLSSRDRLLFYFSGHGQDPPGAKSGYMLFSKSAPNDFFGSAVLKIGDLDDWSRELNIGHFLCILDCCSSGLAFGNPKSLGNSDDHLKLLQTLSGNGSRIVITAGVAGEETFEVDGKGGIFTTSLLKVLNNGNADAGSRDGILTCDEIIAEVKNEVARFASASNKKLHPQIFPLYTNDHTGTFVFVNTQARNLRLELSEPIRRALVSKGEGRKTAAEWTSEAHELDSADKITAINYYSYAIKADSSFTEAHISRGNLYLQTSLHDKAIKDFLVALKYAPENRDVYESLAEAYRLSHACQDAINIYSQLIGLHASSRLHRKRGLAYHCNAEFDLAIKDFSQALSLDSTDYASYEGRADAYLEKGRLDSAVFNFTQALTLKKAAKLFSKRATAYQQLHQLNQQNSILLAASKDYEEALALDSANVQALQGRAHIRTLAGDHQGALRDFQKALLIYPESPDAQTGIVQCYLNLNRVDEAVDFGEKALKGNTRSAALYAAVGDSYIEKNDVQRALNNYSFALSLDPQASTIYQRRAACYSLLNLPNLATEDSIMYEKLHPTGDKVAVILSGLTASDASFDLGVLSYLDEHKLYPDFIVGTGTGSIVGGLYSTGVSVDQLRNLFFHDRGANLFYQDAYWKDLLTREKDDEKHYALRLSLSNRANAFLPSSRARPSLLLSHYTCEAKSNFLEFSTPSIFVLSNATTLRDTKISKGKLFDVISASEATLINGSGSVRIDTSRYLSGALTNPLPATMARKLGADKVIGVGVNNPLKQVNSTSNYEEYKNILLNATQEKTHKESAFADLLIFNDDQSALSGERPDKSAYDSGYLSAQRLRGKLENIFTKSTTAKIDLEKRKESVLKKESRNGSFKFDSIKVTGLEQTSSRTVTSRVNLKLHRSYDSYTILKKVGILYGDAYYRSIDYSVDRKGDTQVFNLHVQENNSHNIKIGLNYNADYGLGFLLGFDTHKLPIKNSAFRMDSRISYDYPKVVASYSYSLPVPIDLVVEGTAQSFVLKNRLMSREKNYYNNLSFDLFLSSAQWLHANSRVGYRQNYYNAELLARETRYTSTQRALYFSYTYDRKNAKYFPTSGTSLHFTAEQLINNKTTWDSLY
jgi:tetratricopeptide (TPR) repeat protein